jgi:hypothetical protein
MNCPIANQDGAETLLAYCARKLNPEAAAALERHIAICPDCREFADGQQAVWQALDTWEALPVTPDFDRRLYQRVDREVSWLDRLVRPLRPLMMPRGLPVAAAACLVIMAGMLMDRTGRLAPGEADDVQVEAVQADQVEHALEDLELLRNFNYTVRDDAAPAKL